MLIGRRYGFTLQRLPIEAGNLKEQSLDQIYFGDVMNGLRSNAPRPEGCSKCSYFILCKVEPGVFPTL